MCPILYLGSTYIKNLVIVYLKFKSNCASCIRPNNPTFLSFKTWTSTSLREAPEILPRPLFSHCTCCAYPGTVYIVLEVAGCVRASSTGLWASRGGGRILPLFLLLQNTVFGKYVLMDFVLIPLAISSDMISSERDYMRALGGSQETQVPVLTIPLILCDLGQVRSPLWASASSVQGGVRQDLWFSIPAAHTNHPRLHDNIGAPLDQLI